MLVVLPWPSPNETAPRPRGRGAVLVPRPVGAGLPSLYGIHQTLPSYAPELPWAAFAASQLTRFSDCSRPG
jgi:hypothetical protein